MKFILAEKKEMTQKFAENGDVIAVTRLLAGPCVITQVKSDKNDGYTAVQLGFGSKKKIGKALKGHVKNLGNFRYLKEFRIQAEDEKKLAVGNLITAKTFAAGDIVKVSGTSKGKGFQGVVKRHGFHGSPATHGHKDQHRMPGSSGAGGPQHVFKGKRMSGHMGDELVTVTNLEVVEVNPETNEIFVKGGVPGAIGYLLLISGVGDVIVETKETESKKAELTPKAEVVEAKAVSGFEETKDKPQENTKVE
ncbi:MAG: 50S ribosomal protein L3 [Patescibacteria group bacterium]